MRKNGQFGPDLNIEILICSESRKNKLSFNTCFIFIVAWVRFYVRLYKILWLTAKPIKSLLKIGEHIAGHYGSKI